jgi:N-acetylmuramoyl-L-alanine amidase
MSMWDNPIEPLPLPAPRYKRLDVMRRGFQFLIILLMLLAPVAVFAAMVLADRTFGAPGRGHKYVLRLDLPPPSAEVGLPPVEGPQDASRPLIVIDAGHGGHDPGARGKGLDEKDLTLSLAKAVRDALLKAGGVRVALTRSDDSFRTLNERSGIARRLQADLFLSIHADSAEDNGANGASVYTLSDRGSSDTAQRMAERENEADTINGVALAGQSDMVSSILVDLSQRETQSQSEQFALLIVREAQGNLRLRPEPKQSAAFVVLKSPDVPSVLFESGYMSNAEDVATLAGPAGQARFGQVTAQAVRVYFARQVAP